MVELHTQTQTHRWQGRHVQHWNRRSHRRCCRRRRCQSRCTRCRSHRRCLQTRCCWSRCCHCKCPWYTGTPITGTHMHVRSVCGSRTQHEAPRHTQPHARRWSRRSRCCSRTPHRRQRRCTRWSRRMRCPQTRPRCCSCRQSTCPWYTVGSEPVSHSNSHNFRHTHLPKPTHPHSHAPRTGSLSSQSVALLHSTQAPAAEHTLEPPHDVPSDTAALLQVPLSHVSVVHWYNRQARESQPQPHSHTATTPRRHAQRWSRRSQTRWRTRRKHRTDRCWSRRTTCRPRR